MQKTIFLILTLLATNFAHGIYIPYSNLTGEHLFDLTVETDAGFTINGTFLADVDPGGYAYMLDANLSFIDPVTRKHHVLRRGYEDDENGGGIKISGEHPRHPNFLHDWRLIPNSGLSMVEGGWLDMGGSDDPTVDPEKIYYHYEFNATVTISLHQPRPPRNPPTVPETSSTLALMGAAFGLLIVARKKLALRRS